MSNKAQWSCETEEAETGARGHRGDLNWQSKLWDRRERGRERISEFCIGVILNLCPNSHMCMYKVLLNICNQKSKPSKPKSRTVEHEGGGGLLNKKLCSHICASFQIPNPLAEVIAGSLGRRTLQDHGRYKPAWFPQSFPKGAYGHLLGCMSTLGTITGIPLR